MGKMQEWMFYKVWRFKRWVCTVHADIYPKSPLFDAPSELKLILFGKWHIILDRFKTPMSEVPGDLDVSFVYIAYPSVQTLEVHYPDEWGEWIENAVQWRSN